MHDQCHALESSWNHPSPPAVREKIVFRETGPWSLVPKRLGTTAIDQSPTLWPHLALITSLESISPNTATLEVRASKYEFRGGKVDTNIQLLTTCKWRMLRWILEKEMATHSSVLAWRIPGTGEPGGLPSMGSHRVRHDWSDLAAAAAEMNLQIDVK